MSETIKKTIEEMQVRLREHEEAVVSTKKLINQLCGYAKLPLMYQDSELLPSGFNTLTVQRNSFFGRPLTACVRDYLEMRKRANQGPSSLNDIFEALQAGGYDLDTISSRNEADQKRGVAISLGKNSTTFIRLPTDDWALLEWYPNIKKRKANENGKSDAPENVTLGDVDLGPQTGETAPEAVTKVEPVPDGESLA
jgi:hypothetical protein